MKNKEALLEERRYVISAIGVLKNEIQEKQGYLEEHEAELAEINQQLAQLEAQEKAETERKQKFLKKIVDTGQQTLFESKQKALCPNFNVFLAVEGRICKTATESYKAYRVAFLQFNENNQVVLDSLSNIRSTEIKSLNEWILKRIDQYRPGVMWCAGDMGRIAVKTIEDKGVVVQQNNDVSNLLGAW